MPLGNRTSEETHLFNHIYTTYRERMVELAFYYVDNKHDAEDIVEDIFLSFLKMGVNNLKETDNEEHFWYYICAIVKYRCFDFWKKKNKRKEIPLEFSDLLSDENENAPLDAVCCNSLKEAFFTLPKTYADVLYFYYYQELSAAQIARLLKLSEAAVRKRIERGKKLLQAKIRRDYL